MICSVFAAACGDDGGNADAGVGTPAPPISASSTSGAPTTTTGISETTTGAVAECGCADGMFCAAAHVGGVSDPDDPSLQFSCQESCVPEADPSQWCSLDSPSCCDGLPCTEDGFCGGNGLGTGPAATSTTGDATDSGGSSGSGTATTGSATDSGGSSSGGRGSTDSGSSGSGSSTGG